MTLGFFIHFMGTFTAMLFVDVCWAKYFLSVSKHKPLPSAMWGSLIVLFGAISTINYVQDKWMLVPAVLGAFVGSYFTVRREQKKENK
jgi:hypothetical protein